jgi:zinc finger protein BrlA
VQKLHPCKRLSTDIVLWLSRFYIDSVFLTNVPSIKLNTMFGETDTACPSSRDPFSYPDSDLSPVHTIFSSGSSWDLSTPTSCPESLSSTDSDDMSFSIPTYPNPNATWYEFSPMPEVSQDGIPDFLDQNMLFMGSTSNIYSDQSMIQYNNFGTYAEPTFEQFDMQYNNFGTYAEPTFEQFDMQYNNFGTYAEPTFEQFDMQYSIQDGPAAMELDMYSPMPALLSPSLSTNFVVPSQTTFASTYDVHSPLVEIKPLPVSSSASNYELESITRSLNGSDKVQMESSDTSKSSSTTRCRSSPARKSVVESLQTAFNLQRLQSEKPGMRQLRRQRTRGSSITLPPVSRHIRVQNKAIKKCEWPGCNGRFQRQEHLKRHEKTHIEAKTYMCQFCDRQFGRSDNLKSHTRLHTNPSKKSSRTQYFPRALEVYEEMSRKPRKSVDSSAGDNLGKLSFRPRGHKLLMMTHGDTGHHP